MLRSLLAVLVAGTLAGAAIIGGMVLLFGPAQGILADPALQSPKLLQIFMELSPPPRISFSPSWAWLGFGLIGCAHALVFRFIRSALGAGVWKPTVRFAALSWLMMALWFEFWILWNVMHEPVTLIALELTLWAGVLLIEAAVLTVTFRLLEPTNR
jgi:hypothetical protein